MPSSIIRAFDYRPDDRQLAITFTTGRRYAYADVPPEIAAALRAAPSWGSTSTTTSATPTLSAG